MKTTLYFTECEHNGDLQNYIEDIELSGGTILSYDIDIHEETGSINIDIKDKDEFLRRTMKVSTECIPYDAKPVEFVRCYRRTLQDMY